MWKFTKVLLVGLVSLMMVTIPLQPVKAEEGHTEEEETHWHRHRIELFLGDTVEHGEHDFSPGLTYEYRPLRILGIGAFWEFSHKKFDKFGVPCFIHPYRGLRFVLAPGFNEEQIISSCFYSGLELVTNSK